MPSNSIITWNLASVMLNFSSSILCVIIITVALLVLVIYYVDNENNDTVLNGIIQRAEEQGLTTSVRYSLVICTGLPRSGKTSFSNVLMKCPHLPPQGDAHTIFIRRGNCSTIEETEWTKIDGNNLSELIQHLEEQKKLLGNESTQNSSAYPPPNKEMWDILILLDISVPTPVIYLLPHALVTFVAYKMCGREISFSDYVKPEKEDLPIESVEYPAFVKGLLSCNCFKKHFDDSQTICTLRIPSEDQVIKQSYTAFIGTYDTGSEKQFNKETTLINDGINGLLNQVNCPQTKFPFSVWFLKEDKILYPINVKELEDENAKRIRNTIKKKLKVNTKYNIPFTWLLLELQIRKVCLQRKNQQFLSFEVVKSLWKNSCNNENEVELKVALNFYHLLGVLLYFENVSGMCKYVFTDCRWLFKKFTYLLYHCENDQGDFNAYQLFVYEGILNANMISEIVFEGEIKLQYFINLLEYLQFIAPLNHDGFREYFMPSILPNCIDDGILREFGSPVCAALLITFSYGSMHRMVFCFLAAYILQHLPDKPEKWASPRRSKKNKRYTYSDMISFPIGKTHFVCISDKVLFLKFEIFQKPDCESIRNLHNKVLKFIQTALKAVCLVLGLPFDKLQFGFPCQNCEHTEQHMVVVIQENSTAHCCKTLQPKELSKSQTIWFSEVRMYNTCNTTILLYSTKVK